MKAVILAGGQGTRLRPITSRIPKPLVEVIDTPCIEFLLGSLKSAGIKDVIITTAYMPTQLIKTIGDGKDFDFSLLYSFEATPCGTAGAVKNVEGFLNETFLVVSGDVLTDVNIAEIIKSHKESGCEITMALSRTENPTEFGIVGLENGIVTRFKEKPKPEEVFSNLINAGIYIIEPEILKYIPDKTSFDFSKNLFPLVMEKGYRIHGTELQGLWMDIGRPSDYLLANAEAAKRLINENLNSNDANGKIKGKIKGYVKGSAFISESAEVHENVEFRGVCYVGPGTVIEQDCIIESSFIHGNCVIDRENNIKNSILLQGTGVGWKCTLEDTILGKKCHLSDDVSLKDCIFGEGVEASKHTRVEKLRMESGRVGV